MESQADFYERVERITERDLRYRAEAYGFVMLALGFTVARLPAPRHVNGQELLDGIREYALEQFGPMAKTVFAHWGIHQTLDFGHVVFNLVSEGLLGKTDSDRLEDFRDRYDFETVFVRNYPWGAAPGRSR